MIEAIDQLLISCRFVVCAQFFFLSFRKSVSVHNGTTFCRSRLFNVFYLSCVCCVSSTCFITRILCWVFAWFYPLSQDSVQQMMSGLMWFTVAANSEVLSFMLLQFNVMILRFLLVGILDTLLLLFLLLLLLHFDVSMLAELFLFGLLAFSGLKVFDVIDSNVMLCARGS